MVDQNETTHKPTPRLNDEARFRIEYRKFDEDIRHFSTTRSALTTFLLTIGLGLLASHFSKDHPGHPVYFPILGFVVLGAAVLACIVFSWRTERSALYLNELWNWAKDNTKPYPEWKRHKDLNRDEKKKVWDRMWADSMNKALIAVIIIIVAVFLIVAICHCPKRQLASVDHSAAEPAKCASS